MAGVWHLLVPLLTPYLWQRWDLLGCHDTWREGCSRLLPGAEEDDEAEDEEGGRGHHDLEQQDVQPGVANPESPNRAEYLSSKRLLDSVFSFAARIIRFFRLRGRQLNSACPRVHIGLDELLQGLARELDRVRLNRPLPQRLQKRLVLAREPQSDERPAHIDDRLLACALHELVGVLLQAVEEDRELAVGRISVMSLCVRVERARGRVYPP